MQEEIWKDITGFEGLYQISNFGNVRVLDRICNSAIKNSNKVLRKGKLLKKYNKGGYYYAFLMKDSKRYYFRINRLVAMAFIPNPNNLPYVNHKDENPLNNHVDNLEWCTAKYNCNYGTRNSKICNCTSFKKGHIPWSKGKKIK